MQVTLAAPWRHCSHLSRTSTVEQPAARPLAACGRYVGAHGITPTLTALLARFAPVLATGAMPSASLAAWERALEGTGALLRARLGDAIGAAAGGRVWAVDLSIGTGGSAPKFFIVCEPTVFAGACTRVAARYRHAYEIVEARRGCFAFFDLDSKVTSPVDLEQCAANAAVVEAVAAAELRTLAAARFAAADALHIDIVALEATRPCAANTPGKYSVHLVLRASLADAPLLLAGPADAGAFARRVRGRLLHEGREGAAALIDLSVYADRRAFRLLGSTKLADKRSVPFKLRSSAEAGAFTVDALLSTLVAPAGQPEGMPTPLPLAREPPPPPPPPPQRLPQAPPSRKRAHDADCGRGRWWGPQTEMPLLDMPRLPHPAIVCRGGGSLPSAPRQLTPLLAWASARLRELGAGDATRWRYERASRPAEALLHVTGSARGTCAHVGREHAGQHVMVTLDLLNGIGWQRCWDQQCVCTVVGGYVKARHLLGCLPADCNLSLESMERALRE